MVSVPIFDADQAERLVGIVRNAPGGHQDLSDAVENDDLQEVIAAVIEEMLAAVNPDVRLSFKSNQEMYRELAESGDLVPLVRARLDQARED